MFRMRRTEQWRVLALGIQTLVELFDLCLGHRRLTLDDRPPTGGATTSVGGVDGIVGVLKRWNQRFAHRIRM